TEFYGDLKVVDDYQWLDNLQDPPVRAWNDAQNAYSRKYFDGVSCLPAVRERLKELEGNAVSTYYDFWYRTRLFALKMEPPKNQPMIVTFPSVIDTAGETVVVDPNAIDPSGTTSIDWFRPSRDGKLVALSLSKNGSEDGTLYIFDVSTGKALSDTIPRVQYPTASGSAEWNADNSGLYYTRYPQGTERPKEDLNFYQQIYYHKLGTPVASDTYVVGKEFPRIADCSLSSSHDGKNILVSVENGDGGEYEHFLRKGNGPWQQITQFSNKVVDVLFGSDGNLYLLSHDGAPNGKILSMPLANPNLASAKVLVPESNVSISAFLPTKSALYVVNMVGGPSTVSALTLSGQPIGTIATEPVASAGGLVGVGGDSVLMAEETYLTPLGWYLCEPTVQRMPERLAFSTPATEDFSAFEVRRDTAISKDGTKVPLSIIMKKGTPLNGQNPTILYGYGGFGISNEPHYEAHLKVWLEQGGIYAIANTRGGGEFGEAWHQAGMLTKKQNVFDDFIACERYLVEKKYTSPKRLAIEGGSNGGLLMGAVLTQEPLLCRAVVSYVGIYDMLRVETFANGQFNVTEYGTVKNPEQLKAMYAYSPYQHVVDGTSYPAVLFLTGDNDGRVDPANSRKMLARLQAATTSGYPVLLRTDAQAGHGIGTGLEARVAQRADVEAFLFDQLGVNYTPVKR
ncbi:MAG TPA: prolyl oligopeptidase family serine peptidase, partial [Bacteroidota bacterium]|nr:prolyl oligopeptidase family serine peptidase [Bacteroidota bacterium]